MPHHGHVKGVLLGDYLEQNDLTLEAVLAAHFRRAKVGDYLALLAYIDRDHAHIATLQDLRRNDPAQAQAQVAQAKQELVWQSAEATPLQL